MSPSEAARLLQCEPGDDPKSVKAAYALAVRIGHPDHGGDADLDKLRQARDVLLRGTEAPAASPACPLCKGKGVLVQGFRVAPCPCAKA